jgi:hypothetical protein
VTTSTEGEVTLGTGKGGDDAGWTDANFTELKNEENTHDRFSWYKWMMKI